MKQGRTLQALAQEIERQNDQKRDFVADTRHVQMMIPPNNGLPALRIGDRVEVGINELAHNHIGAHTKIPAQYYDRMRKEAPHLLAANVNEWLVKNHTKRMIRTLDGKARGFLSDRFRTLDNYDLLDAALPRLKKLGVEVLSCDVTETRMYLKVVDQRMKEDLPVGWSPNNRGHQRFDTVSPALVLSNSEVGAGALSVQTSIYFGGCTNLTVIREGSARKYHIGRQHELGEDTYRMLSDSTKKLTDAALWAQIGDVVSAAFSEKQFEANCLRLKEAAADKIERDPDKVVEVTAKKFGLNDTERGSVLRHLIENGDLTRYGLHNAVTRAAEDLGDYDRASTFEQLGGEILELPKNDWQALTKAASELKQAA